MILIVGGLTFFPALALGPIVEHLAMTRRHAVLTHRIDLGVTSMETSTLRKRMPVIGAARSQDHACRPSARPSSSSIRATLIKNPVMFVVEVVAALTTVIFLRDS